MTTDIETLVSEAIGLLKSLIAIPSLSREEEQAADFLQNYIEMQGMATGRKGNNIWCLSPMFDLNKPTLLLNSHIDTVKPVNGWRKAPFTPTEENGKIYGLGSNDAGASVVSLLQVFLQLCRTTQAYNLIYLASCEEEVSGKEGVESVLPELPPIQFAIVGEPTEMQPAIAEKGLMVEVNTKNLMKKQEVYPHADYLHRLRELDIPVMVNSDCHYPDLVNDGRAEAFELLKKAGFRSTRELVGGQWQDVAI